MKRSQKRQKGDGRTNRYERGGTGIEGKAGEGKMPF